MPEHRLNSAQAEVLQTLDRLHKERPRKMGFAAMEIGGRRGAECSKRLAEHGFVEMHRFGTLRLVYAITDAGRAALARSREAGTKLPPKRGVIDDWISGVAVPYQGDDCLIWPFYRNSNGYAALNRRGGISKIGSRVICHLAHGEPPAPDMHAAHSCGNGHLGCVNPKHLRWATAKENLFDREIVHDSTKRGSAHAAAKLSEAAVLSIRALAGKVSVAELGRRYGVTATTIRKAQLGQSWASVGTK